MGNTIQRIVTLESLVCGDCGITFAVPAWWLLDRRNDKKTWYCPNGHPRAFLERTEDVLAREKATLERRLANEQESVRAARADAELERRRAAAHKGHATRLKNRVAKGKCPCCSRDFPDLAAHLSEAHPGYGEEGE